jgi:hypothetical protein
MGLEVRAGRPQLVQRAADPQRDVVEPGALRGGAGASGPISITATSWWLSPVEKKAIGRPNSPRATSLSPSTSR